MVLVVLLLECSLRFDTGDPGPGKNTFNWIDEELLYIEKPKCNFREEFKVSYLYLD